MTSPAWQHRERVLQQQAVLKTEAALKNRETETIKQLATDKARHELLLTALDNDCKRISALPEGEVRNALKRELLPTWLKPVEAYLAGGQIYQNEVLTRIMVWCFDVGDIETALKLAAVAIEQKQPMPERFDRDVVTYVADAFREWCKAQRVAENPIQPYFDRMFEAVIVWPVHDEIKMKYCKIAAEEARKAGDPERALTLYKEAERYSPQKAQVKTVKAELEKEIAIKMDAARHAKPAVTPEGDQAGKPEGDQE